MLRVARCGEQHAELGAVMAKEDRFMGLRTSTATFI
jgi:hypothetical protein